MFEKLIGYVIIIKQVFRDNPDILYFEGKDHCEKSTRRVTTKEIQTEFLKMARLLDKLVSDGTEEEKVRMIQYVFILIDSVKYQLDYEFAKRELNIDELVRKYQRKSLF